MRQLEHALESRMNIIVVGPTSSGKTTLLGALVGSCLNGERVLILEDTPELRVQHNHVVYMQTVQGGSVEGNYVDLNDLVRNALRMRPDRIVVGECRGDEVFALLNALQTGHTGSLCTLHAKSAQQAITRLRTLLQHAEPSISDAVANKLISLGLDLIVCVSRSPTGERRIEEICDIQTLLLEA
jgi:pilus assembly protein CpaF